MSLVLTPQKGLIFRIVHRDNVEWILDNGLHCANSAVLNPTYVAIGNPDLIDKRKGKAVAEPPGGFLSDYVSFYFTPYSPMLFNIKTGYNGIKRRANEEIVVLVSSLPKLVGIGISFLFTDRHAYLNAAQFSSNLDDLARIDWTILQARDFRRDPEDPGKVERYQAEALVHQHLPVQALLGIGCHNVAVAERLRTLTTNRGLDLKVVVRSDWYFS
ncbi:MAG: DUF4433 domain-containing protein [Azospirillum brasilense]|nr:MAG: DUF4433 domain-containing protein [Azospirillum brasilense]